MDTVPNRSKSVLTVLVCLGLVALAILIFATTAQGAAKFITTPIGYVPIQEPMPRMAWRLAPVDMDVVKALKAPRPVIVAPVRLPEAKPAKLSGGCYTEPGTPPLSVLQRESKGNPTVYNFQGSGASGCWQFMPGTWNNYKGYANAADAPVKVQNEKAKMTWAGGAGCRHWSACG